MLKNIKFVTIRVQCPGSPQPKIETMQIKFAETEDGIINAPCNGCNSMNGTMPCTQCCAAINKLFFKHPETDTTEVIHLNLNN